MKCRNCGGPLSETSGRGRLVCSYCGSIQAIDPHPSTLDRVVLTETPSEHGCPACGVQLMHAVVDDGPVEACSECQGVLFDRETFVNVVWNRRGHYQGEDEIPLPVNREELRESRECPGCHQTMDCHPYYGPGNAVIDTCHSCSMIWLDSGELTTLERAPGQRKIHNR